MELPLVAPATRLHASPQRRTNFPRGMSKSEAVAFIPDALVLPWQSLLVAIDIGQLAARRHHQLSPVIVAQAKQALVGATRGRHLQPWLFVENTCRCDLRRHPLQTGAKHIISCHHHLIFPATTVRPLKFVPFPQT